MNTFSPPIQQSLVHSQSAAVVRKRLPDSVRSIITEFKGRIQNRYGSQLDSVILYGSYARGDFNEDSDVDLLIVLTNAPVSNLQSVNELAVLKYDLMIQYGVLLSVKAVSVQTLLSSGSAIYTFIRREGIQV